MEGLVQHIRVGASMERMSVLSHISEKQLVLLNTAIWDAVIILGQTSTVFPTPKKNILFSYSGDIHGEWNDTIKAIL